MLINSPNISGSLTVTGNSVITGSLTVLGSITGAITGSATSASYVEYSNVANKPTLVSGSSQVTYSGLSGIPSGIVSGSSQVTYSGLTGVPSGIISGSAQVTYSGLTGIPSGIVSGSAQIASFGIFATTGSNGFNGSQSITGSLTVTGQVIAQTLNVQQVTSSIIYSSGSNIFGNTLGNTQQFTGSVSVTGSLNTSIAAFGSAATTFLTSDSGTIKSRTAAQTLSDIAALPLAGGTLTGPLTGSSAVFSGNMGVNIAATYVLNPLTVSGNQMFMGISADGNINSVIGRITSQVRNYGAGIASSSFASIEFVTDGTTYYKGGMRFLVNNVDGTSTAPTTALTLASTGTATFSSSVTSLAASPLVASVSSNSDNDAIVAARWTSGIGMEMRYNPNSAVGFIQNTYPVEINQLYGDIQFRHSVSDTMTPRMIIKGYSGRVGIGTPSPSTLLHVSGYEAANWISTQTNTGTSGHVMSFGYNNNTNTTYGLYIEGGRGNGNQLDFAVVNKFYVNGDGKVGIGTSSPSQILDIVGTTPIINIQAGANNNTRGIQFNYNGAFVIGSLLSFGATGEYALSAGGTGTSGYFLTLKTDGTERMRIISTGEVGIGVTPTAGNKFWVRGTSTSSSDTSLFIQNSTPSSLFLVRNDGLVGFPKINDFTTGNSPNTWINPASSYGIYINTSSIRYKKDIVNYDKGLTVVNQLRPVYYKGTSEVDGDKQFAGFIAEEIDELGLTEFVNYLEDGRPNSLSYPNMVVLLTKAIQELKAENDTLKSRIDTLEQA